MLLSEAELEELYIELAEGRWQSVLALPHHHAHQVLVFAAARNAQWTAQLEQKLRGPVEDWEGLERDESERGIGP